MKQPCIEKWLTRCYFSSLIIKLIHCFESLEIKVLRNRRHGLMEILDVHHDVVSSHHRLKVIRVKILTPLIQRNKSQKSKLESKDQPLNNQLNDKWIFRNEAMNPSPRSRFRCNSPLLLPKLRRKRPHKRRRIRRRKRRWKSKRI